MILSFKKQFKQPILDGTKIHTIREDEPDRWHDGRHIHFANGVRTKNYDCFKEGPCVSTQPISIIWNSTGFSVTILIDKKAYSANWDKTKDSISCDPIIREISENDGFENVESFFKWFNENFRGKLIHWTEKRY